MCYATATLNLIRFGVSFVVAVVSVALNLIRFGVSFVVAVVSVDLRSVASPKGGGDFLILHYIGKAGEDSKIMSSVVEPIIRSLKDESFC
jgi:hypothetical protein